jgi:hypothetical protein
MSGNFVTKGSLDSSRTPRFEYKVPPYNAADVNEPVTLGIPYAYSSSVFSN